MLIPSGQATRLVKAADSIVIHAYSMIFRSDLRTVGDIEGKNDGDKSEELFEGHFDALCDCS